MDSPNDRQERPRLSLFRVTQSILIKKKPFNVVKKKDFK